jgi:hypothetical protein
MLKKLLIGIFTVVTFFGCTNSNVSSNVAYGKCDTTFYEYNDGKSTVMNTNTEKMVFVKQLEDYFGGQAEIIWAWLVINPKTDSWGASAAGTLAFDLDGDCVADYGLIVEAYGDENTTLDELYSDMFMWNPMMNLSKEQLDDTLDELNKSLE